MDVAITKQFFKEMKKSSDKMKCQFASMVLLSPQILDEDDLMELRQDVDDVATNFDSIASWVWTFGRLTPNSRKWIPKSEVEKKHERN